MQDMTGAAVVVPAHPHRIADLWFAHNEVLAMLGATDRIAVTVDRPMNQPWLFRLNPQLSRARQVMPGSASAEGLLADGVDLVFVSGGLTQADPLRVAGLPVLDMTFQDVGGLLRSVALTADVLNDPVARGRASSYTAELEEEISYFRKKLIAVDESRKPRVLHVMSLSPLLVDGAGTIIDQWIRYAGGRNAAGGVSGVKKPVTMEQIQVWDPDIIIVQGGLAVPERGNAPAGWDELRAVKQGRVFANPVGVFPWDRYGSEFLLQLRWVGALLHPDIFGDYDLKSGMKVFYRTYFDHEVSDDEIGRMLAGQSPRQK
ncbi:Fe3+ transporter ferrichrome-binding periplasmic protein [Acetobacter oeni LMG 21952]|nr:Fe3+ transporter ferrichrome-binding periplasmic protein [Acetobacter oeni LMG 21952]